MEYLGWTCGQSIRSSISLSSRSLFFFLTAFTPPAPFFSFSLLSVLTFPYACVGFLDSHSAQMQLFWTHLGFRWIGPWRCWSIRCVWMWSNDCERLNMCLLVCLFFVSATSKLTQCHGSGAAALTHIKKKEKKKRAAVVLQGNRDNKCFHTCTNTRWKHTHPPKKYTQTCTHIFMALSLFYLLLMLLKSRHQGCTFGTERVLFLVLFIYLECFLTSMWFWLCELERGQRQRWVERVGWEEGVSERQMYNVILMNGEERI